MKIGFNRFGLETMKLNVYEFNEQSIHCYESIGFKKSLFREKMYQDSNGVWWNNFEMALNKGDWLRKFKDGI